jgi:hypothetical protein
MKVFPLNIFILQILIESTTVNIPVWEMETEFDPTIDLQSLRESPAWVAVGKEVPHLTAQIGSDTFSEKISEVLLRDPHKFVSGELHKNYDQWYDMLNIFSTEAHHEVSEWIQNCVDISRFSKHFKGNFKGQAYNSAEPPKHFFSKFKFL